MLHYAGEVKQTPHAHTLPHEGVGFTCSSSRTKGSRTCDCHTILISFISKEEHKVHCSRRHQESVKKVLVTSCATKFILAPDAFWKTDDGNSIGFRLPSKLIGHSQRCTDIWHTQSTGGLSPGV